ncbi:MAG: hypothetical protein KGD67_03600 [Candidatus Lokiarchaeota archaeon]|nr:hypothetical protein [Candidatus Lokiarchaeota archaeon]
MPIKKTYYFISIFFLVFLSIAGVNVKAHPPSNMSLEFNSSTNILKVSITHGVSDNTTHYIYSILISVNGSVDQSPIYTSQPDLVLFSYEYTVVTNDGSTIQVSATCIEGGTLTRTLGGTPSNPSIPGFMGLYLVLIVSVIGMLTLICKKLKTYKLKN